MSLVFLILGGCIVAVLAALAAAGRLRNLRRGPHAEHAPETKNVGALYSVAAPLLAFAIVTALFILVVAGPCGLEFGYEVGTLALVLGYGLIPVAAAALAFGLSLNYGRRVVFVECGTAIIVTVVLIVYGFMPHQPSPTTYDPSNRCAPVVI